MSRKRDMEAMASLVGNSAAHVALLPGSSYAQKEASTYTDDAAEIAAGRTWNEKEIREVKKKALARAGSEIRRRIKAYGLAEKDFERYAQIAEGYIEAFVRENMERKR